MQLENQQDIKRDHHLTIADKHPRRMANVLIVDDDVDTALFVQKTFGQMGCNINFALDAEQAKRMIASGKPDIVILDWMLDHKIEADEVLLGASRLLKKFHPLSRMKVITFTGRDDRDIHMPESPFYQHVDHWQKPMKYAELTRRTLRIMNELGF